jgi:hypothetical protein
MFGAVAELRPPGLDPSAFQEHDQGPAEAAAWAAVIDTGRQSAAGAHVERARRLDDADDAKQRRRDAASVEVLEATASNVLKSQQHTLLGFGSGFSDLRVEGIEEAVVGELKRGDRPSCQKRSRSHGRDAPPLSSLFLRECLGSQSHFFQRKKPSIATTIITIATTVAMNPRKLSKPGKWTFMPKKPVMNVRGSMTTLKIVST